MAAVEPVIWPSSFSIGMAVTEHQHLPAGRGVGQHGAGSPSRSGRAGPGRWAAGPAARDGRQGKVMPQVAEWKRRPISSASRRPSSAVGGAVGEDELALPVGLDQGHGNGVQGLEQPFRESSATRRTRSSWSEAFTCSERLAMASHNAASSTDASPQRAKRAQHPHPVDLALRNMRPNCPVLLARRFGRHFGQTANRNGPHSPPRRSPAGRALNGPARPLTFLRPARKRPGVAARPSSSRCGGRSLEGHPGDQLEPGSSWSRSISLRIRRSRGQSDLRWW